MKKIMFFSLLTGAMLAGCSSSDLETTYEKEVLQHREIPVEFNTFLGNSANTRAGETGILTTDALKAAASQGFGVFAYYTNGTGYSASATPNFMYNEQVTYKSGNWTYAPIKYWPNEFQTSGDGGVSENIDKLTFFAYAPWVGETANGTNAVLANMGDSGITNFSANNAAGDPTITYTVAEDADESVDLLWASNASTELKDLTKPTTSSKVNFTFNHALARLGLKIRSVVDEVAKDGTNPINSSTTILLSKITIESSDLKKTGTLNLNTGDWTADNTADATKLVIEGDDINLSSTAADKKKVTTTLTDVLNAGKGASDPEKYFMFIPSATTESTFNVTVEYTVETVDPALAGTVTGGSNGIKIENKIKNTVKFTPEKTKAYNFDILIGVTSVKVEATVTPWTADNSENNVWVPVNKNN
ncbi:MAG: fimbrillin family protein [Bacteroidaceae bacterium]|nr:fimbrillin family protein [Bacteroidaceae bacterium]